VLGGTAAAADEVRLVEVAGGLEDPVYLANAGDGSGRVFVVEQAGRIRVAGGGAAASAPFLDISAIVRSGGERGLLSVAFHPEYARNGFFYVNYTDRDGDTVVARYAVSSDAGRVDPASANEVITVDQPYRNHNGGQIQFGPDGYLYIGMGDGGWAGDPRHRAQNLRSLLGKILRLDVDSDAPYSVPPDNPFVMTKGAAPEIWALGVRNPWRFSFDRLTGDLYIGDVGQNKWEEIDVQPAESRGGENYGWRIMEGAHCFNPATGCARPDLTLPVYEYSQSEGCSVTGGYVYRGGSLPDLEGTYIFADYCAGTIWGLTRHDDGSRSRTTLVETGFAVSSFGEDEAGELYVLDYSAGRVLKLVPKEWSVRGGWLERSDCVSSREPCYATEMSELSKRHLRIREHIVASRESLDDWDGIGREASERRGGLVTKVNESDGGRG